MLPVEIGLKRKNTEGSYMSGLKRCCVGQEQSHLCHKRSSCYWYWQSL